MTARNRNHHNHDGAPTPAHVLVVEDDASIARLLDRLLSRAGYVALHAGTGPEALRLARQRRPAVITLDLMLPGMSGEETLAALKADAATRAIPVVVISIHGDDADLGNLPIVATLRKPIDSGAMLRAIADAVRGRRASNDAS